MFFLIITFLSTFFSIFHLVSASRYHNADFGLYSNEKGVSILIPCLNEEPILKNTIKAIDNLNYDNLEVIIINDGSTDETMNVLNQILDLEIIDDRKNNGIGSIRLIYRSKNSNKIFYVIDKYNSGKADSLNIGIAYASREIIVTMDADCILERNALKIINESFVDDNVIASCGAIHTMQYFKLSKKQNLLIKLQTLDFIKGFYIYKESLAYNEAITIISGAFGAFKKDLLIELGGYSKGLGEDIDITIRLQEYACNKNKRILFCDNAICYTECPENLYDLTRQRIRWQKGFIDSILKNKKFLFKNIKKNTSSFFLIVDALISNSVAIFVLIINILLIISRIIRKISVGSLIYLVFTVVFNIIYNIYALIKAKQYCIDIKIKDFIITCILDIFYFRFLCIYFYIKGSISYLIGKKDWGRIKRTSNIYTNF